MDARHAVAALRYVERNPVRAGLALVPWEYEWSSARFHVGRREADPLATDEDGWFEELAAEWDEFLSEPDEESFLGRVRREAVSGRPLGGAGFVRGLERRLGRELARGQVGRPRSRERERYN